MPIATIDHGIEIIAEPADLIADYVPDSSGRYRLFRVGDYLVTSINDDDVFAERLTRAPQFDGDVVVGDCGEITVAEWMLTDRVGSCGDLADTNVVWIDGVAYTADWEDNAVCVTAPPATTCMHVYFPATECPYCDLPRADVKPAAEPAFRLPTPADVSDAITRSKREILADIAAGHIPASVATFSELHDYTDANEYGGLCDSDRSDGPEWTPDTDDDDILTAAADAGNAVQNAVDAWLRAGRPEA